MRRDKNGKILAIVALCVAIFGLTIGFAAFSNTLTISSSATVSPNSTAFNVDFSTDDDGVTTSAIVPSTTGGATASNATINNGDTSTDPVLQGVSANFSAPGQTVKYDFFAYNSGEYDAYLNSVVFSAVNGSSDAKVCSINPDDVTAGNPTASDASLTSACSAISIKVVVGDGENAREFTASEANVSGITLAKQSATKVSVILTYAADGARADGNFKVDFGNIVLTFGSAQE